MARVSILLRTRDAGALLGEVLDAIEAQTYADRELVAVDSGSRDGTPERLRERGARVVTMSPEAFTHARSTNLGFEAAGGELVVSLSQDATPADPGWLARLVAAVSVPEAAAAFGRQLARPGCFAVERIELARAYPPAGSGNPVRFSNVNSIVRRDLWARHRFDENLSIAEDQEWAGWARSQGGRVVYVPDAAVWHSHDYTLGEFYRRCLSEGRALARFGTYRPGVTTILLGWPRQAARDFRTLWGWGLLGQWPRACVFRMAQLVASYRGARGAL